MAQNTATYFTLDNGMRCVHLHQPGAPVGYFGAAVRAGSRDEDVARGQAGLAHFVEHTIFKGTARRSSWHIINRMEAVGGELNAFTGKEDTVVYAAFSRPNLSRAAELIADLITGSRFPKAQLDREREVVCDEIDSYLDQPSEAVFDDFEDLLFPTDGLGHNILGTRESVRRLTSEDCVAWLNTYYNTNRIIIFYAGAYGVDTFRKIAERYYSDLRAGSAVAELPAVTPAARFDVHKAVESLQANVVMGSALPPMPLPERMVMALLTNILGGPGMNSLLNVELRERRGLVYNVETSVTNFSNCGEFLVYFGCDPSDEGECRRLVQQQLEEMASHCLSERRLTAARKQYLGQLILANDNRENRAIAVGRATLFRGRALTSAQVTDMVRAVTPQALRDAAALVVAPSVLTLGPN